MPQLHTARRRLLVHGHARSCLPATAVVVLALTAAACGRTPPAPTPTREPVPFTIVGTVLDSARRPLAGARVDVVASPAASGTTDSFGNYSIPAVLAPGTAFDIRASADQYLPASQRFFTPNLNAQVLPPALVLAPAQKLDLRGDYTLTVSASPACVNLPLEVRERVYHAMVEPSGSSGTQFTIALGGAVFVGPPLMGTVTTALNFASVSLFSGVFLDDYEVFERVGDGLVSIYGSAGLNLEPQRATSTAPFDGVVGYCRTPAAGSTFPPRCDVPAISCRAADHRLTLERH